MKHIEFIPDSENSQSEVRPVKGKEARLKKTVERARRFFAIGLTRSALACLFLVYALALQSVAVPFSRAAGDNLKPKESDNKKKNKSETKEKAPSKSKQQQDNPASKTIKVFNQRFERTGPVTREVQTFTLPAGAVSLFYLQVVNGEPNGSGRVLDGMIKINGVPVFGPGELNLQTPSLTVKVNLALNNAIEVEFFSPRRNASLNVAITATVRAPSGPPPVINSFTPDKGIAGMSVTLNGARLKPSVQSETSQVIVTFAGPDNTRRMASISFASPTQVRVTVPNGAITGPIELINDYGRATTPTSFNVEPTTDFAVFVSPTIINAVQTSSGTAVVSVNSVRSDFTQLAALTTTGLPQGVTTNFEPSQITAGATSTMTINLGQVNLSPGSYSFTVRGTAQIDGTQVVRMATATLNVIAAGQTTLVGRVMSTLNEPIMGATASLDGISTTTDTAGVFILSGVMAGMNRPVKIDGRTANAPGRTYPEINEAANIVAGQTNINPYIFYLPPIDIQYEAPVIPGQETIATTPRLPDYTLKVPVGANLRNRDGSPVTRMSVTPLPIDRIPAPLPPNVTTGEVWTAQPGGALSDIQIPVTYPNDMHADPGAVCDLYIFDHDNVRWRIYGTGRVSPDGRTIVPDINPNTGRPYGLDNFAWHLAATPPTPADPKPCNTTGSSSKSSCEEEENDCGSVTTNPVDLSTGNKIEMTTDISFGGARGGLELTRTHTTGLAVSGYMGRFGLGMKDNYDITLTGTFNTGGAGRFVTIQERNGRLFSYSGTDPIGAFLFISTETVSQLGDVVRRLPDGAFEYRYRDGRIQRFDSNRRLVAMVDRNGNTTTLTYTGSLLTSVTDAVGRSVIFNYDASNRVSFVTDPLGRLWSYTYDSGGRLSSVTDPQYNIMQYLYDGFGRLTSITDPRGINVKQITYNAEGRVSQQQFADGGIESYSYTQSGATITSATVTDPLGRVTSKRFNASGYVVGEIDALGQESQIERNMTNNLPISITGPCGCLEVARAFDNRGNPLTVTNRLGQTTRYVYDPVFNNVTQMTDRLNRVTNYGYDARGNMISMTNALNETTTFGYDGFGQLISITDALGYTSRLEYDAEGNVRVLIDALGNRMTLEYDGIGRLTALIDPLGRRVDIEYDAVSRIVAITDAAGAKTRFDYDGSDNLVSLTDALSRMWTNVYDLKNNLLMTIDPLGRTARYEYNANDELISMTSSSGRTTRYAYDARGQVTNITDPLGGLVQFAYDNRGNLTTLTDQRGNTTTFTYDELYRPKERRDPLGKASSVSYDAVGNAIELIDRLNRRTNITYDALNRPAQIVYADATIAYNYDAAGRRTNVSDTQGGSIVWTYDDADRLLSETTPAGTVSYTYNAASQRATMTAADRPPVNYGYDAAGRLQTITQGAEVFTYSYDTLSRLMSLQRPNGVMTAYSYDNVDRLARLTHTNAQNQAIEDFQYTYNADDEIFSINSLASAQLMSPAQTVGPANAANRITQFGQATFNFDDEGQTTSKTDNQGTTNYQWDARGRLTRATLPNGQAVNYGYDARGKRSSRTASGVTTNFLYDIDDVVLDRGSDNSTVDYLNGLGIDDKLRQASSATGGLYFLQDHLGSMAALTDSAGNVVERMQYEAFGEINSISLTRYGYIGREREAVTNLMYYRARWHDANQGRFISEDPIGYRGGLNLYAYVGGDPINRLDSRGLAGSGEECCEFDDIGPTEFQDPLPDEGSGYPDWVNNVPVVKEIRVACDLLTETTQIGMNPDMTIEQRDKAMNEAWYQRTKKIIEDLTKQIDEQIGKTLPRGFPPSLDPKEWLKKTLRDQLNGILQEWRRQRLYRYPWKSN